jgi:fucose 4-O-acetylase-like acetyltransferase
MTRRLLILNGLAALMIPLHHAAAYGLQAMFLWTDRYQPVAVPNYDQLGSFAYYALMISRELHSFAVPAFMFVSGFFVAFMGKRSGPAPGWKMGLPRIKALLPPLILWTIFRFVLIRQRPDSIDQVLGTYWFIVLLIQFYLIAPWLITLARTRWRLLLAASAVIQLLVQGLRYPYFLGLEVPGLELMLSLTPRWFFPFLLFNFSLGLVAGMHLQSFERWLAQARWPLLATLIISVPLMVVEYELADRYVGDTWIGSNFTGLADNLYSVSLSLTFLAFGQVQLPFSKQLSDLGTKSLGIYMANIPAIYVTAVLLYELAPWVLGNQLFYQAALIAAGLGGPLMMMEIMRRSTMMRRQYRFVFG